MASSRLPYDSCSYTEKLRASVGPGMYMLGTPENDAEVCAQDVPADPYFRYQKWGPTTCPPGQSVDDGSELRGLNYKASKCSADSYLPNKWPQRGACGVSGKAPVRECAAPVENTRLSNPPCTLRGTGWNRWEWLCWDPQERAMIPFDHFTPYRIVAKDNHRPCLETPMDQTSVLPRASAEAAPKSFRIDHPMVTPPGNPYSPVMAQCARPGQCM